MELGPEWFLLDGLGSSVRAELLKRHGMSSLPHVFIGGTSIGGLYSGNEAGVLCQTRTATYLGKLGGDATATSR